MKKPQVSPRKLLWFPVLTALVFLLGSFRPVTYMPAHDYSYILNDTSTSPVTAHTVAYSAKSFISEKMDVFDSLHLAEWGLSKKVFEMGLRGMFKLTRTGLIKSNILSIVDFSQPSTSKRLYVIDLDNYSLLYNTWVAHGAKTGKNSATYFSNKPSSHKSSLGFYVTGKTYTGQHGLSLRINGLEKGINDKALARRIVVHGSRYVGENFLESNPFTGRSYGCPAATT